MLILSFQHTRALLLLLLVEGVLMRLLLLRALASAGAVSAEGFPGCL